MSFVGVMKSVIKIHYLLAIKDFDLIFSFLEGWLW